MVLARVPPNRQQRGQSPRGTEFRGLIFTLVAVAKWIMALSGLRKGSNCCAFLPAKLQPSPVDGSAAGIFHRAEVGGWTCAPLLEVSCLWLVRSSHACRPDGKCATFAVDVLLLQIDRLWSGTAAPLPGQRSLIPSSSVSVPKFRSRKRDTSFHANLGPFQLTRDSARVASRCVTLISTSSYLRPQRVGPVCQLFNPAPKSGNVDMRVWAKGPVKLLVAYCRRDEWVALISPEGLFGEFAPSLISRLGPEFQTLFETLVL